ncbi:LexA family transcriptional regulator [Maritalea porphyrae]|uniref:LexA family transcriptional regulator n=1 Tax=Maritalea porphyrae TaxID=880732 RepID=UPI0022B05558|nr:LexA family transcriptional regulator [Maritalea porphyrae]MCZ4274023.1 LexA family transcriptional regulator [Maritalea porphyrae]
MGSRISYVIEMKNRIKQIMKQKNVSRDELADAVDAHPITISKLVSGKMNLTTDWMERIAKALRVRPEELISAAPALRTVTVNMHVEAGSWAEANVWEDPDQQYQIAVPNDPEFANLTLHGAETRGPSMNKRYPSGTIVVYTSIYETDEEPVPGRRYIIECERTDGLREATVKTLHKDEQGCLWLMPESNDPRHQQPIEVNGNLGDTIRIVGRVVFSVQKET